MNWLLTMILLATIISWAFTHRYLEQIEAMREAHRKEIKEYEEELRNVTGDLLEAINELDKYRYKGGR